MILNVIKESEYTYNNQLNNLTKDDGLLRSIKEKLDESKLRYVSPNVRELLGITKPNDPSCFTKDPNYKMRVVEVGEKFRVILYIRLSQEDGDLEDGDVSKSIKNQLLYLLDECEGKNWEVVGIFCEEDISGCDDNRKEWLKSLRFAEVGNTEIVLCKSQSRFTRSMEMVEKYLHKCFPEWNVRFLGLVDNSDTYVEENKKSRQINGLVNEWYVEDTSKNTRVALNTMKKNGQFTGSFAPFGYLIDPKDKHHLIADMYARNSIKIMAGMLIQGKSMQEICEVLMRKGFLTPADYKTSRGINVGRGRNKIKSIRYQVEDGETLKSIAHKYYVSTKEIIKVTNKETKEVKPGDVLEIPHKQVWTAKMIHQILTDETQIGTLVQGKTRRTSYKNKKPIPISKEEWIRVPHCHEANLDLETFKKVNEILKPKNTRRVQKNGELPLFSKKVYCACCGKALHKNHTKTKYTDKEYLRCRGTTKQNGYVCNNSEVIDLESFKDYILSCIKNKINTYYNLSEISKEYNTKNIYTNLDKDIEKLEKDKDKINMQIDEKNKVLMELYKDKALGVLTKEEFNVIKSGNTLEVERLKAKLNDIDNEILNLNISKTNQIDKVKLFEKYKDITELNRLVLDSFISKIEIGKKTSETDKRYINIKWNICAD